jgi:enamine deaminase RidA (YjgF/YER057c/UK114 family)
MKIAELGLTLPSPPAPGGVYYPVVVTGNLVYLSGHLPFLADGSMITGKLGADLTTDQGYDAARQAGLVMVASIEHHLGWDKIGRLIKTLGMVNCTPDFIEQPKVINGFSDLMISLLGEDKGKGARSAVGMMLPRNAAVEVEAIFELK